MRQPLAIPKRRIAVAIWLTVVALPLLVLSHIARADPASVLDPQPIAAVADPASPPPTVPPAAVVHDSTTSTEAPPTTTEPPTTTTTTQPPTTTTAPEPVPETASEPEAVGNAQTGGASWYSYRAGECAHRTIAKGTTVSVTNLGNGATTSCVVTDRGPFTGGRIIDLDDGTFSQIASTGQGVVQVSITW